MNREIEAIIILFKDRQPPTEQKSVLPTSPALLPRRLSWTEDSEDSDATSSPEKLQVPTVNLTKALKAEKKRFRLEETKSVEVKARPLPEQKKLEGHIKKVHNHSLASNGLLLYQVSWYGDDSNGKPWPKTWNTVEDCCAQSNWGVLRMEYTIFRSQNPNTEIVSDSSEESGSGSESSYESDESESDPSSSSEEEEAPGPSSRKRGMSSLVLPPGKRVKMTTHISLESDSSESESD